MDRATANHHRANVRARTVQAAANPLDGSQASASQQPSARRARMRSSSVDSIDGTPNGDAAMRTNRPVKRAQPSQGLPLRPHEPEVAAPSQQNTPVVKTEWPAQGQGSNKRRDTAALKAAELQAKRARLSQGYSRPS